MRYFLPSPARLLRLSVVALSSVLMFTIGACEAGGGDAPPKTTLSTGVTGTGGTGEDYGKIRVLLEVSTDALRSGNQVLFEETHCAPKRRPASEVSNLPTASPDPIFSDLVVEKVEDIHVTGDTATAKMTVSSGGELATNDVNMVRDQQARYGWLVC